MATNAAPPTHFPAASAEPSPAGPMAQWHQNLAAGRFMLQRCGRCAAAVFPPRRLCPHCAEGSLTWFEACGRGTVHAVTVVARPTDKGGPYNVVLVDLEEGVRMMSRVVGVPPEQVRIGDAVQARVEPLAGEPAVVFGVG